MTDIAMTRRRALRALGALTGAAALGACARKADVRLPDGQEDKYPRTYPPAPRREEEPDDQR